jgi:hypothetical protein
MRGQTLISSIARIARREIDRKTQCRFSSAMASIWKSGEYDPNCEPLIVSVNPGSTQCRNLPVRSRSAGCKHRKTETCGDLPSRSSPRYRGKAKVSAFAKATARQSSPASSTRAKTGGKGIRTPDFQLAKLALYQLSYAPVPIADFSCGLRIGKSGA